MQYAARNWIARAATRSADRAARSDEMPIAVAEPPLDDCLTRPEETFVPFALLVEVRGERERYLEYTIRQRIESRLPGRVRNLVVQVLGDRVLLDGQCATYYSKQLAQHAALGVLNDEHLENLILVNVPR